MHSRPDPFEPHRRRLWAIAYRMLGSRADADDVVQDAWLRWQRAPHDELRSAEAWLVTATTRLAIDLAARRLALAKDLRDVAVVRLEHVVQQEGRAFIGRQAFEHHEERHRAGGDTEQRLYLLDAWRDAAHLYSEREQAALAWTEAITQIADGHAPDDAYEHVRARFNDKELVDLTLAIATINGYNRMNIAFRVEGGSYRPGLFKQAKAA